MRLLLVVPCRNEAAVIGRKLANLARARWPVSKARHRVLVIDDGSDDGTRARAHDACAREFAGRHDVEALVLANDVRAGKPGAIRTALARADGCDLVVLTDADVVVEEAALIELASAFEREPRLAMACGAQRFVRDLANDGSLRGAGLAPLVDAGGLFDRATARVRAFESRWGCVFSVHGQLLAWRAELALEPRFGIAADDLDLRFQVKARERDPRRVEVVASARFVEPKIASGPARSEQALRRARAWFQALDHAPIPARGGFERAQTFLYRFAPRMAPLASAVLLPFAALACALLGAPRAALGIAAVFVVLAASPLGRRWFALARTIRAAARAERDAPLGDRWETSRS